MFDFMRFRKEAESVGKQLKGLRGEIEEKKRQREDLEHAPLSREDLADGLCARVDALAGEYPHWLERIAEGTRHKPFFDFGASQIELLATNRGNYSKVGMVWPETLVWFIGPDQVKQRVRDAVHAMEWPDDQVGPPIGERRQLMAKLDKEIADLEKQEAKLIEEARKAGLDIGGLVQGPAPESTDNGHDRSQQPSQDARRDEEATRARNQPQNDLYDLRTPEEIQEQEEWRKRRERETRRQLGQHPEPEGD